MKEEFLGKVPEVAENYLKDLYGAQSEKIRYNAGQKTFFNTISEEQCHQFCQSGKCKADCCGCVSLLESHFRILKKLIPVDKEYFLYKYKESDGFNYVKPITPNYKCVFLSESNSCSIHESHLRPAICRRYGSDEVEPLYTCMYVNEEFKDIIQDFAKVYLQKQTSNGNVIASHILKECSKPAE